MLHTAKISVRPNNIRSFHIECSCSTAGDFDDQDSARAWMKTRHFAGLTGIDQPGEILLVPTPVFLAKQEPEVDLVDQFHKAVAEIVSANAPTPSTPTPASPPESGEEVKSETVGDA